MLFCSGSSSNTNSWGFRQKMVPGYCRCCKAVLLAFWGIYFLSEKQMIIYMQRPYIESSTHSLGSKKQGNWRCSDSLWRPFVQNGLHGLSTGKNSLLILRPCTLQATYTRVSMQLWQIFAWITESSPKRSWYKYFLPAYGRQVSSSTIAYFFRVYNIAWGFKFNHQH